MVFQTFFRAILFHRSRNNRRDKLRSKFWREKMFRKPEFETAEMMLGRGTNKTSNLASVKNIRANFIFNEQSSLMSDFSLLNDTSLLLLREHCKVNAFVLDYMNEDIRIFGQNSNMYGFRWFSLLVSLYHRQLFRHLS